MGRRCFAVLALATITALGVACVPDEPPEPPPPAPGTCLDGTGALSDLRYDGPIDTAGNATQHDSVDGSCGDEAPATVTVVRSTSGGQGAADERCETVEAGFGPALPLRTNGYDAAPTNLYLCEGSVVPPPTGEIEPGTCFDTVTGPSPDLRFDGPDGGTPNASLLGSTDGSCSGEVQTLITMVFADDQASANALCESRGTGFGPATGPPPGALDPAPPARAWLCIGSMSPVLDDPPEVGDCYDGTGGNDMSYRGGLDDLANLAMHASLDGTCADPMSAVVTGVWAATPAEAAGLCEARRVQAGAPEDPAWTALAMATVGYPGAPNGLWVCNGSFGPPPPPPLDDPPVVGDCWDGAGNDLSYLGGLQDVANLGMHPSMEGTCADPLSGVATGVWAATPAEAAALCETRRVEAGAPEDPTWTAFLLATGGYPGAPNGLWVCNGSIGPPPPPPPPAVSECHSSDGANNDVGLSGPLDTQGNAVLFPDGSNCATGPFLVGLTMVQAASPGAALELCQAVAPWSTGAVQLSTSGWSSAPADRFLCLPPTEP